MNNKVENLEYFGNSQNYKKLGKKSASNDKQSELEENMCIKSA